MQLLVASARRDLPKLTTADVEMLNDYLFDGQPMTWTAKEGFQPGVV